MLDYFLVRVGVETYHHFLGWRVGVETYHHFLVETCKSWLESGCGDLPPLLGGDLPPLSCGDLLCHIWFECGCGDLLLNTYSVIPGLSVGVETYHHYLAETYSLSPGLSVCVCGDLPLLSCRDLLFDSWLESSVCVWRPTLALQRPTLSLLAWVWVWRPTLAL